jgi:hypothetical protein
LLLTIVCMLLSLPLPLLVMWVTTVSGNSRSLRTEFHTGVYRRSRVAKEGFHL